MSHKRPRLDLDNSDDISSSSALASPLHRLTSQDSHTGGVSFTNSQPSTMPPPRAINRAPLQASPQDVNASMSDEDYMGRSVETDEEIQAREDSDALNEVIMAIDMKDKGTLGCAFYVAREELLCIMEDVKMVDIDIVDTLKMHTSPTTILISTRADEALEAWLQKDARGWDRESSYYRHKFDGHGSTDNYSADNNLGSFVLDSRPAAEFKFDSGLEQLTNLDALGLGADIIFKTPFDDTHAEPCDDTPKTGRSGRLMRLAGWIDLESRASVGCAGAVLAFLQRRRAVDFLPNDEDASVLFRTRVVEMFSFAGVMFVNADTFAALQIIHSENHPNPLSQGRNSTGSKESLSVFGLFVHLARTPQGKLKLKQRFMRPSMDLAVLTERFDTLAVLLRVDNAAILQALTRSLRKIKNIRTVVLHLQKGVAASGNGCAINRGVWGSLQSFTYHAIQIVKVLQELVGGQGIRVVTEIFETFDVFRLQAIGTAITNTVDFERSAENHRTVVMHGVDNELDNLKRTYDGMDSLLTKVATSLCSNLPEWARQYIDSCTFVPQLGFLTVVALNPRTGNGMYEGEGTEDGIWQKMFSTEQMGYFKNPRMRQLDDCFGDMYGMICDKEIEIIHLLAVQVLEHNDVLIAASDMCGELDCFVAFAEGAIKYDFVSPRITKENIISITGGRHPLQELAVRSYVPNDLYIAGGSGTCLERRLLHQPEPPSTLLMTGANYSGKSVFLKQTAIIVYMAHIGSFVPAEKATIGLTDKILTRIVTRESVSRNQSAFMVDLQQIALALTLATRQSLIIIDEFGKGTESTDGAGIACGVFGHLVSLGDECPKVIGATHFHEIFEAGYLEENSKLAFGHMEVRVDREADVVENQITYLYNFQPGRSTSSYGTCCAALNGIDPAIINRADDLIILSARGEDLAAACTEFSEEEVRDCENAELIARNFLLADLPCRNAKVYAGFNVHKLLGAVLDIG